MPHPTLSTHLRFRDTDLVIIDHDGHRWVLGADIARALGYRSPDKVGQIYRRRSDEFRPDMSVTLKLSVRGEPPHIVRAYSARGAYLLAMFPDTPIAKEFRGFTLDVLERELSAAGPKPTPGRGRLSKSRKLQGRPGVMVVPAVITHVLIYYPRVGLPTLRITGQSNLGKVGIEEVMPADFDQVIRDLVARHSLRAIA